MAATAVVAVHVMLSTETIFAAGCCCSEATAAGGAAPEGVDVGRSPQGTQRRIIFDVFFGVVVGDLCFLWCFGKGRRGKRTKRV